ncbi:hypothetical protein [Pseudomonas sp. A214]|uniref:hypothetical protein n=1 Tax=Pseudomonas sp. A214 TaxID=1855331 RepID=UPI000970ECFD|nr:hypothetical protein [Pseudomonas sp. A214]
MKNKIFSILATFILPIALFIFSPYWGAYFSDKKQLSYELLGKRGLTNLGSIESAWPGIKILYEDQDVSTGSFLTLAITNTGKVPIKREDFDSPIIARVVDSVPVLSYKITYSNPANLDIALSKVKEGISIAPMLLNPGDRFVVEIFSKAPLEIVDVTSRIVGIPNLSQTVPEPRTGFYVGLSSLAFTQNSSNLPFNNIPFWIVFALANILLIGTLLNLWFVILQPSKIAKITLSCFTTVIYALSIGAYTLCISYFVEILDLNKWLGLTILLSSITLSGYGATMLRRNYFPELKN